MWEGGGGGPPFLTPNFEAQIFLADATPYAEFWQNLARPPLTKNPGSAPDEDGDNLAQEEQGGTLLAM